LQLSTPAALVHCAHLAGRYPGSKKGGIPRDGRITREIAQMDAVIICVPTPLNEHHEPDLSYVTGTVESIAPYIHEGQLIVLESTTYPGTTEEMLCRCLRPATRTA
jgi:UDP-N-acetyl-D-mannosaminuronate dehydrogenase